MGIHVLTSCGERLIAGPPEPNDKDPMADHMFALTGKRALVTGASRGIGKAIAEALAQAGADVAVAGRDGATLAAAARDLAATGRRIHAVTMDVARPGDCQRAVAETVAAFGGLDILVNNAGVEQVAPSLEVTEELWDRIVDTNLKGAFFMAQAAARAMASGVILNICSLTSERGIATAVPYGASKTGLLGMTRALAAEWAPRGIRVNGLEPGYFRTALTEAFYANEAWQQAMLAKIPMKRFGQLDDLTGAAVFLCSDAARYITGTVLPVDGGTLAAL
jgi:NAD(P)-dependent dehydrogenase (short-subunit alcohol dehydrogenase family)